MSTGLEEYQQQPVAEEAVFRVFPLLWTVKPASESHSVAIIIRFGIEKKWHPEEAGREGVWSEDWPMGWYVDAQVWVVKKDGTLNTDAITNLGKCGLWDGDFDKLQDAPPQVYVHLDVQKETWQGKDRYRGAWINPDADVPQQRGMLAPADQDLLHSLKQRFGANARAVAGGKPAGAPGAPPRGPAAKPATSAVVQEQQAAAKVAAPANPRPPAAGTATPASPRPPVAGAQHAPVSQGGPRPPVRPGTPLGQAGRPQQAQQQQVQGGQEEGGAEIADEDIPF